MAFSVRNARVERKARAYASAKGDTLTGALERALDTAMAQDGVRDRSPSYEEKWRAIQEAQRQMAALPVLDPRTPDEILYDEDGIPH